MQAQVHFKLVYVLSAKAISVSTPQTNCYNFQAQFCINHESVNFTQFFQDNHM